MRRLAPILLLLAASASAGEPSLASYLPPDTPVYMEMQSPTPAEMKTLAMSKVFEDPRMKALLSRVQGAKQSFSSMRVPVGDAVLAVRSDPLSTENVFVDISYVDAQGERSFRVRNRAAAALVDVQAGTVPLDAVAACEVEGDAKAAVATIERIAAAAAFAHRGEPGGDIDAELGRLVRHTDYRGVTYAWADVGSLRVCLAPVGKLVVLTLHEARMKDILDRFADGTKESLATDPRHLAMQASVPGDGTATTQMEIHLDRALRKFQAAYPQYGAFAQKMLVQVGLRDLESVTTLARVSGEGIRSCTAVVLAPAESRAGLGRLFEKGGPPPSFGGLAYAPKDSFYVNCGNVDIPALHRTVMDIGGFQVAMAVAVPLERNFGLKLKEDLCDLLGPEMTLIVAPNHGLIPDVALVSESKDATRLEANLLKILTKLPWPPGLGVATFRLRDVDVHSIPLGNPKLGNIPLAPTFGVVDGRLVLAPYPLSFQRILAVKRGDKPSILENREFGKLREVVPAEAQGVSYLDLARIFELVYDTFIPFAQAMSGGASPPQLYEFPDVETLSQHLFGRVAWRTADEHGVKWESYASMDTSTFTLSLFAGASMGLYYLGEAKEARGGREGPVAAPKASEDDGLACRRHVRRLRGELLLFRKENRRLPDRLEEIETQWMDPGDFVVPGTDGKPYVYLGPAGKGDILLYGYPNGSDSCVTILTVDLRPPERITAKELERRLVAQEGR
jgi:hypothetical protein